MNVVAPPNLSHAAGIETASSRRPLAVAAARPRRQASSPRLGARLVVTIGAALLALGVAGMAGWLPPVRGGPLVGSPGVAFGTTVCLALAGAALAAHALSAAARVRVHRITGVVLALLSTLGIALGVAAQALGVSSGGAGAGHGWQATATASVDRIGLATALGFFAIGGAFIVMHAPAGLWRNRLLGGLLATPVAVGGVALAGLALSWPALFGASYLLTQVGLPTALGLIAAGAGAWLAALDVGRAKSVAPRDHTARITASSVGIMLAMALAAGIAGFRTMQAGAEETLFRSLQVVRQTSALQFAQALDRRVSTATLLATRPYPLRLLRVIDSEPAATAPQQELTRVAVSFLDFGFSAINFYDRTGKRVVAVGTEQPADAFGVPLAGASGVTLLWSNGFVLRVRFEMREAGELLGSVVAEQPLEELTHLLRDTAAIGASADVAVCAPHGVDMQCFPSHYLVKPGVMPRESNGRPLPMAYALRSQTGLTQTFDYRGIQVHAAYGPVAQWGLGMVVKLDSVELFKPIAGQFVRLLVALLVLAVVGVWLMRRAVRPLSRRLETDATRLRLALKGSRLAMWDWNVASGQVDLSGDWGEMIGESSRPVRTTLAGLFALVHAQDRDAVQQHVHDVLKGRLPFYDIEHRIRQASGSWMWIRCRGETIERDANGRALRLLGTNADITARKQVEFGLAHGASHDALTGLPNRRLFFERLQLAIARARRESRLLAVICLDVDNFKQVNDGHGHGAGDALLNCFAQRLVQCVRTTDTVARIGGDEFALILEGLHDVESGRSVAEKIVAAMRRPFAVNEDATTELSASASLGLAFYDGAGETSPHTLMERADAALYAAKAAGRANFQVAEPATPTPPVPAGV